MAVRDVRLRWSAATAGRAAAGRYVPGTLVVAYLVAFGRWGSHVHLPSTSLYVTDILLASALIALWFVGRGQAARDAVRTAAPVLLIAVVAVVRLVAGGVPSLDGLRDAAPYCYSVAVVLPFARRGAGVERRTLLVIHVALLVRLACVVFALLFPGVVQRLPEMASGPDGNMLSIRADYDSAMLVVLAVLTAVRLVRLPRTLARLALEGSVLAVTTVAIFTVQSRAGVLALLAGIGIAFVVAVTPIWRRARSRSRAAAVLLAAATLAILVPQAAVFQRIADAPAALGISVEPGEKESDATGTVKARLQAWERTIDYTNAAPVRRAVGVGFGPDFLHDSGAAFVFEGNIYSGVRAPHNFLVNTFARLGYVGAVVVLLALVYVLIAAVRSTHPGMTSLTLVTVTLFVTLVITAMLGVVLESPFGAVPAYWAAGWILRSRADPQAAVS